MKTTAQKALAKRTRRRKTSYPVGKMRRMQSACLISPPYQPSQPHPRLLAIEISDDEDDDFALQGIENTPNKSKLKRKRQRSRSRSITPPPAIPLHQLQNARNVIRYVFSGSVLLAVHRVTRQALAAPPRAASPSQWDDINDISTDTIILDPELDRLAKQSAASFRSSPLPREGTSNDTVEITVVWKPHPLNEQGKSDKSVFKMNKVRFTSRSNSRIRHTLSDGQFS